MKVQIIKRNVKRVKGLQEIIFNGIMGDWGVEVLVKNCHWSLVIGHWSLVIGH
jgi:hypothetical protein